MSEKLDKKSEGVTLYEPIPIFPLVYKLLGKLFKWFVRLVADELSLRQFWLKQEHSTIDQMHKVVLENGL